ncbi:hypothetical protein KOI35_26460 [Actinoplanes bogorensis]|uniref:Secreted protein n=1 Tax=Paractinoplanes bogorensis TaxID=1610840 RepID=A0ABS5YUC4_9ACTN|nr:hypothetical protein [Actinoplanes bogorensis]MBU2667061.1 hypothetical protein [Actinoplanes bogorensis]
MQKTVWGIAIGMGIAVGSTLGAAPVLAAPAQCCSGWSDDLASGLNDGWENMNGGSANDSSSLIVGGLKVVGGLINASQKSKPARGSGSHGVNDPDLAPATVGTVGLDTEGNAPIKTVGGDTGLSTDGQGTAPTSAAGTVNIETPTAPDCDGFWLVTPEGC